MRIHDPGKTGHTRQPHRTATPAPPVQRPAVHDVLRGSGHPLAASLQEEMETRLGADFSHVRVHTDGTARASATEIGARAYTSGSHVVIGDGGADKHTLAHELTHVMQQRSGPVAGTDTGAGLRLSDPSDRFERQAEASASRVTAMGTTAWVSPGPVHGPAAQSQPSAGPVAAAPLQRRIPDALKPAFDLRRLRHDPEPRQPAAQMKAVMGADFCSVRAHSGSAAQRPGPDAGTGTGVRLPGLFHPSERGAEANARPGMTAQPTLQRTRDWKNNPTQAALTKLKTSASAGPETDTLHHIIPKALLKNLADNWIDPDHVQHVRDTLKGVAPTASFGTPGAGLAKAFMNIPANFAVGPRPEDRSDDPGNTGADVNRDALGSTTPRSKELEKVFDFLKARDPQAGYLSEQELEDEILKPIKKASETHGSGVGIDQPRVSWFLDPISNKYRHAA